MALRRATTESAVALSLKAPTWMVNDAGPLAAGVGAAAGFAVGLCDGFTVAGAGLTGSGGAAVAVAASASRVGAGVAQ